MLELFFLISASSIYGQRIWGNPIGQYSYNPAGAAMNDLGEITTSYYRNYISAINSPRGFLLTASSPFTNNNVGAGFRFTSESGGVLENVMAEGTFVYKVQTGRNAKLSFGLSAVYNQMGINSSLVNAQDPNDPILILTAEAGSWFDTNFGISFYQTNKYYVGLAAYNLMGQQTNWLLAGFNNRSARLGSFTGMYTLDLFQGKGKLETSGVCLAYLSQDKYSLSTMSYDISSRLIFNKSFWIGSGYSNHMAKLICGVSVQNLSVGYAGAIGVGAIASSSYTFPKHELFLKVELDTSKSSRKNANR